MRWLFVVSALLIAGAALSQESRAQETEHKTETSEANQLSSHSLQHLLPPSPVAVIPVVNIYTGKHAGEESHCAQPKDWKEWGAFSWCRSLEWIDAERVIAIWTVVLGVATFFLYLATRKLVQDAKQSADRQNAETRIIQRAYLTAVPHGIVPFGTDATGGHMGFKNVGHLPARKVKWKIVVEVSTERKFIPPKIEITESNRQGNVLAPGDEIKQAEAASLGSVSQEAVDTICRLISTAAKDPPPEYYVYVWGAVSYEDGFEILRHTRFCHRYYFRGAEWVRQGAAYGGSAAISAINGVRHHEYGNDAD
jgi:hypothetical protein